MPHIAASNNQIEWSRANIPATPINEGTGAQQFIVGADGKVQISTEAMTLTA